MSEPIRSPRPRRRPSCRRRGSRPPAGSRPWLDQVHRRSRRRSRRAGGTPPRGRSASGPEPRRPRRPSTRLWSVVTSDAPRSLASLTSAASTSAPRPPRPDGPRRWRRASARPRRRDPAGRGRGAGGPMSRRSSAARAAPRCGSAGPRTGTRSLTRSSDPAVDQRARVDDEDRLRPCRAAPAASGRSDRTAPRAWSARSRNPSEPERHVDERDAGPGRERREPEHGGTESSAATASPATRPTDAGGDLGGRDLAELLLHRAHGGGRLPAKHAAQDEPGRRAQDHVGEGLRGGRRRASRRPCSRPRRTG